MKSRDGELFELDVSKSEKTLINSRVVPHIETCDTAPCTYSLYIPRSFTTVWLHCTYNQCMYNGNAWV